MKTIRLICVLALILSAGLFAGCNDGMPLSNEEIVEQTKYCADNGMAVTIRRKFIDGRIFQIECYPNDPSK